MVDYRVVVSDTSAGKPLADIPLTFTSPYSRTMNGVGSCVGAVPLDHPKCTPAVLEGDREITILRDDIVDWNGPVTRLRPLRSSNVVEITAREPTWFLGVRELEMTKNFNADIYYIARWLFNYALAKRSNGTLTGGTSINAPIPRLTISPSGSSGVIRKFWWPGTARLNILSLIDQLVADPSFGLDYKMVYAATGSQSPTRTFTLASPSLGVTRTRILTQHVLKDYGYDSDRDRAGNRVHVVGAGYTYTLQNAGSIAAADILLERSFDRSDTSNRTVIQNFAADARRVSQPPVRTYTVSYKPSLVLPHGWVDLGDKVPLAISGPPILALSDSRRVMEISMMPPSRETDEVESLTFNLPLDQLGT